MDVLMTLEKSANATAAIARGVRPEQFDNPTPRAEWKVEQLMNHLIGNLEYFRARAAGKTPVSRDRRRRPAMTRRSSPCKVLLWQLRRP